MARRGRKSGRRPASFSLGTRWGSPYLARLAIEPLEDRRMLAIDLVNIPAWVEEGPAPIIGGNTQGITEPPQPFTDSVSGAVEAIAVHPLDSSTAVIATVNGGLWITNTLNDPTGTSWTPIDEQFSSMSFSAVAFDRNDPTGNTLLAGTGRFTSGGFLGSQRMGVISIHLPDLTWQPVSLDTPLRNLEIRSIVTGTESGTGNPVWLVAATDFRLNDGRDDGGLFRSTDLGLNWSFVSSDTASGLTPGSMSHAVQDPTNPQRFFAAISGDFDVNANGINDDPINWNTKGIFRSIDAGATWTKLPGGIPPADTTNSNRIELAVSPSAPNNVFAAIISFGRIANGHLLGGRLTSVFHSTNSGDTFAAMPLPASFDTDENGTTNMFGLHSFNQGMRHFSMTVDPRQPEVLYLAGDTQPLVGSGNAAGLDIFAARIFRHDAAQLTNNFDDDFNGVIDNAEEIWVQVVGRGANDTAPHADSRDMVFVVGATPADDFLLEADDGGVYRLSNTQTPATRRWTSLNGQLGVTEIYSVAFDPVSRTVIAGTQDNGVVEQADVGGSLVWNTLAQGDGGIVQVDPTNPGGSLRYVSNLVFPGDTDPFLFTKTRDSADLTPVVMTVAGQAGRTMLEIEAGTIPLLTPYEVNAVAPAQIMIGASQVYESIVRGTKPLLQTPLVPGNKGAVTAIAYGGRQGGEDFPNVAYVGYEDVRGSGSSMLLARITGEAFQQLVLFPGALVRDIALHPDDFRKVYVLDNQDRVWRSEDEGKTWQDISGNLTSGGPLSSLGVSDLKSIAVVSVTTLAGPQDVILVGALGGVFRGAKQDDGAVTWSQFGQGLPNVSVTDLRYTPSTNPAIPEDDVLVVGTSGRGAWSMRDVKSQLLLPGQVNVTGAAGVDAVFIARDPRDARLLVVSIGGENTTFESVSLPIGLVSGISVDGAAGDDSLLVDSQFGAITIPSGIFFQDSDGANDELVVGGFGRVLRSQSPLPPDGSGFIDLEGSGGFQSIAFSGVETFTQNFVQQAALVNVREGLQGLADFSGGLDSPDLLGRRLPVIGESLGALLNGTQFQDFNPLVTPSGASRAMLRAVRGDENQILRRIFESGTSGFDLDEIGESITTLDDLRARLDDLDEIANNVSFTITGGDIRFDLRVEKTLSGTASLDLAGLSGAIDVGGQAQVSADVAVHLIFGVDASGFFIDADSNPDAELSVGNIRITGLVDGVGRLGMTDVFLSSASLTMDPLARLTVDIKEPGPDPLDNQIDRGVRLHELTDDPNLVSSQFATNPLADDFVFTGTFAPAPVEAGQPAPFGLAPGLVTMSWSDINNPIIEDAAAVTGTNASGQPNAAGQELVRFLQGSTDELRAGLAALATQFLNVGNVDVLGTNLTLTSANLGQVLNSVPAPIGVANADVLYMSDVAEGGGFNRVVVYLDGATTLAQRGVAVGDGVQYTDTTGALVTDAVVDTVGSDRFTLRFGGAATKTPRAVDPSFQIERGGSLADQLGAFIDQAFEGDTPPTLQELARRLELLGNLPDGSVSFAFTGTAADRVVEITAQMNPQPLEFRSPLNLSAAVTGLSLPSTQDLLFTIDPSFQVTAGMRLAPDLDFGERFYLKDNAASELTLQVSAALDNPGGDGTIGFLNVRLQEDPSLATNNGIDLDGTVGINLIDPRTVANDGRIELTELLTTSTTDLAAMVRSTVDLRVDIDDMQVSSLVPATGNPSNMKIWLDGASGFGHITSTAALAQLPGRIQFLNKDNFTAYNNITGAIISDALNALVQRLTQLGQAGAFSTKVPLVNFDVAGMFNFGAVFDTAVGDPTANQTATAAALVAYLQSKFPGVQTAISGDDIRFTVSILVSASRNLPLGLNLGGALGSLSSSGALDLSAAGNLQLVFGVNTAKGVAPGSQPTLENRAFVMADGSSNVSLNVSANAGYDTNNDGTPDSPDLDLSVGLGPLGVSARDARAGRRSVRRAVVGRIRRQADAGKHRQRKLFGGRHAQWPGLRWQYSSRDAARRRRQQLGRLEPDAIVADRRLD